MNAQGVSVAVGAVGLLVVVGTIAFDAVLGWLSRGVPTPEPSPEPELVIITASRAEVIERVALIRDLLKGDEKALAAIDSVVLPAVIAKVLP